MILFFTLIFYIKSYVQCEIDDYFCLKLNKIEDRWDNPQFNLTDNISNEIQILVKEVKNFSISDSDQSNFTITFEDDKNIDVKSKFVSSYLLKKVGEDITKVDKFNFFHVLKKTTVKTKPSLSHDFRNGYKIDGHKGTFSYKLDKEVPLHKIIINKVENMNCSIRLYSILVSNQTFSPEPLVKGTNVQEYIFPEDQFCGGFKIEIIDNYGDNFTCISEISAYQSI